MSYEFSESYELVPGVKKKKDYPMNKQKISMTFMVIPSNTQSVIQLYNLFKIRNSFDILIDRSKSLKSEAFK